MQSLSEKCTNILHDTTTTSPSSSSSPSRHQSIKSTYPSFFDRNEKFIKSAISPINNASAAKFQQQDPLSLKMNSLRIEMYPTPWSQIAATLADEFVASKGVVNSSLTAPTTPSPNAAYENMMDSENSSVAGKSSSSCGSSNSHKLNRKTRNRKSLRYMTQPITLIEIKETEEDCNFSVQADSVAAKPPAVVNQSESSEPAATAEDRHYDHEGGVDSATFANTQLNSQTTASYYDQMSFARRQNRKTIERSKMQRPNVAGNVVGAFD